jgi:hypothetical protein
MPWILAATTGATGTDMTKHPQYRGVYVRTAPRPSPYFARVWRKDAWIFSAYFKTPEGAARAYDVIAAKLQGAKAVLNFPDSSALTQQQR